MEDLSANTILITPDSNSLWFITPMFLMLILFSPKRVVIEARIPGSSLAST